MKERKKPGEPRFGMVIDTRKCIGCHTCSVACKSEYEVPLGVFRSWVKVVEKGEFPNTSRHYLPSLCNHCENPVCATVCPTKAAHKTWGGIQVVDPHKCISCRICLTACPYDVRFVHPYLKIIGKCDFCIHRVREGLKPVCVEACRSGARVFGDLNDPSSEISKLVARNPVQTIKPELNTEPRVFYLGTDDAVIEARGGAPWMRE